MFEFLAQCAQVQVPEASQQALRYYCSGNILWGIQQIWSLLLPALFLWTGFSGKLSHFAENFGKRWYFSVPLYLVIFIGLYQLISFPLAFYSGYLRPHSYGLSTQSLSTWFSHYALSVFLVILFALAFVWIFYWLLKKSPSRWWVYSGFVGSAIVFFVMVIQPIWIDPLFNDFGPMKNKELEAQILDLASKAGIEGGRIFEVHKSGETKMLNAYVTGFGKTKRIVLWDTLIEKMTPDQTLFVMGHEMGHYVLYHMWWFFLYFTALLFAIFYGVHLVANRLIQRFSRRFGFSSLSNVASFPLFLLLFSLFSLLSDPLTNAVSRIMERQADQFGLDITHSSQAAGETFVVLQEQNLGNPDPGWFFVLWRGTHPSLKERIDFANRYCPWNEER